VVEDSSEEIKGEKIAGNIIASVFRSRADHQRTREPAIKVNRNYSFAGFLR
jgi:hypothetical protein